MKLGKIFICINILVMLKWPRIIYQNTSYRFDEYNRTIVLDDGCGHSYDIIETENGYFPFYCRIFEFNPATES